MSLEAMAADLVAASQRWAHITHPEPPPTRSPHR